MEPRISIRICATVILFLSCWFFSSPILDGLFCLAVFRVVFLFLRDFAVLPKISLLFSVLLCPLALVAFYYFPATEPVPYVAVLLLNLMVAYVFANNLLRGRPTILLQFVKSVHLGPKPSTDFRNYLRQQCFIWSITSLASATLAGIALVSEVSRPIAGQSLVILFLLQALWFVVSHEIAHKRFGRPEKWLKTLQLMMQRRSWERLEI